MAVEGTATARPWRHRKLSSCKRYGGAAQIGGDLTQDRAIAKGGVDLLARQAIEGVFCACTETTGRIIGVRLLATLRDLGTRLAEQRSAELARQDAAEILRGNPLDVPFAVIYLLDEDGTSARRVAGTRLPDGSTAFPKNHPVHDGDATTGPWPLRRVVETQQRYQVSDLPSTAGVFPAGPWPNPVETAFVLPLAAPTQPRPAGFLIAA
jgi:hypothetical protein